MSTTMQDAPTRSKEQVIATLLGRPSFEEIDWRTLMKQGVLVRLRIRRCRFTAKLELADLGVSGSSARVRQARASSAVTSSRGSSASSAFLRMRSTAADPTERPGWRPASSPTPTKTSTTCLPSRA